MQCLRRRMLSLKSGPVVQLVRTLACHARGRRFEPVPGRHLYGIYAFVAQLVEQRTENPRVGGSIPPQTTIKSNQFMITLLTLKKILLLFKKYLHNAYICSTIDVLK